MYLNNVCHDYLSFEINFVGGQKYSMLFSTIHNSTVATFELTTFAYFYFYLFTAYKLRFSKLLVAY